MDVIDDELDPLAIECGCERDRLGPSLDELGGNELDATLLCSYSPKSLYKVSFTLPSLDNQMGKASYSKSSKIATLPLSQEHIQVQE